MLFDSPAAPAAPAKPAAPAAPAGPIVVSPSGKIAESAVERASREARERVAAGGSAVPAPAATPAANAGTDPKPGDPPRDPKTGQFVEPAKPGAAAAPAAGQDPKPGDPAAPGAEGAKKDDEPVAGAEGEEEIPEGETPEQKTERERKARTVTLSGRNAGDEFELELPEGTPREVIDAVKNLRNGHMRGEEIREARATIERQSEQLASEIAEIELDPVGFVMAVARDNPEIQLANGTTIHMTDHLVLHLLTDPANLERLGPKVRALLDDEKELRTVRAEVERDRSVVREQMRTANEERATVSKNLQDVQGAVARMLPTELSESAKTILFRDCLRDLKDYADRHNLMVLPVKDLAAILATRLESHGINPVEAARRAAEPGGSRPAGARSPTPKGSGNGGPPAKPGEPTPTTGKRFVASATKRGAVSAIPPGGAGSPGATSALTPPKNPDGSAMTTQQRLDWHRARIKAGQKLI